MSRRTVPVATGTDPARPWLVRSFVTIAPVADARRRRERDWLSSVAEALLVGTTRIAVSDGCVKPRPRLRPTLRRQQR